MNLRRLGPAAVAAAVASIWLAQGGPGAPVASAAPAKSADICPAVTVSCPDSGSEGAAASYGAEVSGGDSAVSPTFNWTVSAGSIESGQGTPAIGVATAGLAGSTITATVDVGGYSRSCSASNSCTMSVARPSRKFAEYVTNDLAPARPVLDRWLAALAAAPEAQGYLIAYGGRSSGPDDAQKAADAATDYTLNVRKVDGARTLSGVGGYRDRPTVELFISAPGAGPPMGTPTVDPKDVKPR
ncbi:MAG TPA: hypothetical protein VE053_03890 [Allosphingosinicella sp.]|nr:hypothetical protein [Allosphingosinicella sp.]